MSTTGVSEAIGSPPAQIASTLAATATWIVAVVVARVPRPFLTLVYTDPAYGVLPIVLSAALSPFFTGELQGPTTNPFGPVAVLVTNAPWGPPQARSPRPSAEGPTSPDATAETHLPPAARRADARGGMPCAYHRLC
ncbi:hypothetical protein ACWFMI_08645 [Nocardiopsis terrae]